MGGDIADEGIKTNVVRFRERFHVIQISLDFVPTPFRVPKLVVRGVIEREPVFSNRRLRTHAEVDPRGIGHDSVEEGSR